VIEVQLLGSGDKQRSAFVTACSCCYINVNIPSV